MAGSVINTLPKPKAVPATAAIAPYFAARGKLVEGNLPLARLAKG
jgi:hypothetical protein